MIVSVLKSLFISLGIGFATHILLVSINSHYILQFLMQNIVNIQIGLLAINTATLGIILTKLRDLVDKGVPAAEFQKAKTQMLLSIKEQVGTIVSALLILTAFDSPLVSTSLRDGLLEVLLIACFAYSLLILYDTAKSVFVVLDD